MKLIISFPRELTLAAFSGITQYYETVESQLESAANAEKQSIQQRIENMHLDTEAAWKEWDLAMQEYDMTFNMLLPNFFRYSFIVLLCLVIENKLAELSRVIEHNTPDSDSPPYPRQDAIGEYKKYYKKAGISDLDWKKLHELNKVRNCVVHASGKVQGFGHETFLRQLAEKGAGLHISGPNYALRRELHPLYLEDDMLVLEPEYCREAAKQVRRFFEALCNSMDLPPLTVENES